MLRASSAAAEIFESEMSEKKNVHAILSSEQGSGGLWVDMWVEVRNDNENNIDREKDGGAGGILVPRYP